MIEAMDACRPGEEHFDMLWVPWGSQPPSEWLAAHPGWVKFPAMMVPRNPDGSRRPWAEIQALLRETDPVWGTGAPPPPSPQAEPLPSPPGDAAATPPGGAAVPADPIGTYLRMAKVFDHSAASAWVVPAASKPRQYADAAQVGSRTDAAPEAQRLNTAGVVDDASGAANGAAGSQFAAAHVRDISARDRAYLDKYYTEVLIKSAQYGVDPALVLGVGMESGFASQGTYNRTEDAFGMTGGATTHMSHFDNPKDNVDAWFRRWGPQIQNTGSDAGAFINGLRGKDAAGHAEPGWKDYNSTNPKWARDIADGIRQMRRDLPLYLPTKGQ